MEKERFTDARGLLSGLREDTTDTDIEVHSVSKRSSPPILVEVQVNGQKLTMEVDTGAAVSIVSEKRLKKVLPHAEIKVTDVKLKMYTSERIPLLGVTRVAVKYGEQRKKLILYVTKGEGPTLLDQEWLRSIQFDWKTIGLATLDSSCPTRSVIERVQRNFPRRTWYDEVDSSVFETEGRRSPTFPQVTPTSLHLEGTC